MPRLTFPKATAMIRFTPLTILSALTLAAGSAAQQLATYDPAATPDQEYAASPCAGPGQMVVADLVSRPASSEWWRGAIAADNHNQWLYYATGNPAHGIQRVSFAGIGTGILPTTFATPPGFNQITGMVVDPSDSLGDTLFITNGEYIAQYHAPSGTYVEGPFAKPIESGLITGLGINPFSGRLWTVDSSTTMQSRFVTGGHWSAPQVPAVAVPIRATGISFCNTEGTAPYVSYWDGTVLNVQTGATIPFLSAYGSVRHHRGLAFVGIVTTLIGSGGGGGGGGSSTGSQEDPRVRVENGFMAGNDDTRIAVDSPLGIALLGIDFNPTLPSGISLPGFSGLLLLNPASTVLQLVGPGTTQVPFSLVGVPPGIAFRSQAVGVTNGLSFGDAIHFVTHL